MLSQELSVIRIPPYHYIHVLDQTTNVTRLEVGPATFVRKDNEKVESGENIIHFLSPTDFYVQIEGFKA